MVSSRPGAFKVDSLPQHRPPQRAAVRIGVVEENPIEVQQTGLGNQFRSQPPNGCRRREPMAGPLQLLDDVPAVHEQRRPPHECLLLHPGRAECASRPQPGGRRRRTASHSGLSASEPKPGNAVRRISLRVPFLFARLTPGRVRATRPFFGWVTLTRRRVRLSRSEYRSGGCPAQSEPGAGTAPHAPANEPLRPAPIACTARQVAGLRIRRRVMAGIPPGHRHARRANARILSPRVTSATGSRSA